MIQCEQGVDGRLYHQSHDTMDGSGSCRCVVAIHTSTTVYHDDSLEDTIHVRCYTLFQEPRDLLAVKIQQICPNHCSRTPSIIERARTTRC